MIFEDAEVALYLAQDVGHGHATLGVRVADADADAGPRSDDLVGHVRVRTDAVAHQAQGADDGHVRRFQFVHHLARKTISQENN